MTKKYQELESEWKEAETSIQRRQLLVFPGLVSSDAMKTGWDVDLGLDPFLDLAKQLNIRMVNAENTVFSFDELEEMVSALYSENEIEEIDSEIIQNTRTLAQPYIGKIMNYWVEWVYEGVLHIFIKAAGWTEDLESKITDEIVLLKEGREIQTETRRIQLKEISMVLANDVEFQKAKNWTMKYEVAQKLYPKFDEEERGDLVAHAAEILQNEIVPEKEKEIVKRARELINSGQSLTRTANQLGMTPGRMERLLAKYPANS